MNNKIILGTSIAPYNYEKQRKCIQSWIDSGFEVVSFNDKEEMETIACFFCDIPIKFVEISRNAQELSGKKLPYIQDILDGVAMMADAICGYCNSDIYFNNVDSMMYDYICSEALNSVVIVHRNEVESLDEDFVPSTNMNFDGIDTFFIDKSLCSQLYGDWAYVQMVWDTFLLITCKKKGITVKTLMNPITLHEKHRVKWDYSRTKKAVDEVNRELFDNILAGFRDIFFMKYNLLLEYSKYISYGLAENIYFLLVGNKDNILVGEVNCTYDIASSDANGSSYDLVVYCPDTPIRYEQHFFNFLAYVVEKYSISELNIGAFFWSCINGLKIYNQLNKNPITHKEIVDETNSCLKVYSHMKNTKRATTIFLPTYKFEVKRDDICEHSLPSKIYVMPAGYRGNEWVKVNECILSDKICGYIDNSIEKQGINIEKYKVYGLDEILLQDDICIIVATKYYYQEIRNQLLSFSKKCEVYDADRIVEVTKEGHIWYFE